MEGSEGFMLVRHQPSYRKFRREFVALISMMFALMRNKRAAFWIGGILFVFIVIALIYQHLGSAIIETDGKPFCHKQVEGSLLSWLQENGADLNISTNFFPNIDGDGTTSLHVISNTIGDMAWAENYNYVPGLKQDDPGDLVLMYFNRPTRWISHVKIPKRNQEKGWIIVSVDFGAPGRAVGPGELSEHVSETDFRERLTQTLDFLRTNERPHWQKVVREHEEFLNSL